MCLWNLSCYLHLSNAYLHVFAARADYCYYYAFYSMLLLLWYNFPPVLLLAQFVLHSANQNALFSSLALASTSLAVFGILHSSLRCISGTLTVFLSKNNHLFEPLTNVLLQSLIKLCFVGWLSVISLCRKEEQKEKDRSDIFQCETMAWFY